MLHPTTSGWMLPADFLQQRLRERTRPLPIRSQRAYHHNYKHYITLLDK